ncbi:MAG: hypothetical protein ACYC35_20030 [Pirellulales bacterium]
MGVPRRFGIATMMIFTAIFAVLFAVLKALNFSPAGFAGVSIFIGGVAACQSLLFRGKAPRAASIVGGSILLCVIVTVARFADGLSFDSAEVVDLYLGFLLLGGLLGYGVGVFIAAIFLIRKEPANQPPKTSDPPQNSSPPAPREVVANPEPPPDSSG